jgi:hypothetical protein
MMHTSAAQVHTAIAHASLSTAPPFFGKIEDLDKA